MFYNPNKHLNKGHFKRVKRDRYEDATSSDEEGTDEIDSEMEISE